MKKYQLTDFYGLYKAKGSTVKGTFIRLSPPAGDTKLCFLCEGVESGEQLVRLYNKTTYCVEKERDLALNLFKDNIVLVFDNHRSTDNTTKETPLYPYICPSQYKTFVEMEQREGEVKKIYE